MADSSSKVSLGSLPAADSLGVHRRARLMVGAHYGNLEVDFRVGPEAESDEMVAEKKLVGRCCHTAAAEVEVGKNCDWLESLDLEGEDMTVA